MGGFSGEVRGPNKGAVAEEFQHLLDEMLADWSVWPPTRSKRRLKAFMEQDPETLEWVLRYRASK
ncbi:MAG: hypothetical protein R3E10_10435 [Gemmatimonadota bacterium]